MDFSGVTLPFTVSDIITGGAALLGIVGTVIALGLAFRVAPKFISLIFSSIRGGGSRS